VNGVCRGIRAYNRSNTEVASYLRAFETVSLRLTVLQKGSHIVGRDLRGTRRKISNNKCNMSTDEHINRSLPPRRS
jgi:hypothetical protein